jgi:hypothetical protein
MDLLRMVIFAFVIFLLLVLLRYIWSWINGVTGDVGDLIVYGSSSDGLPAKSENQIIFSAPKVPQIYAGGEYSVSVWFYVTNWNINKGKNKPFLILSGGAPEATGFMTLVMYLGQYTNKLGIRVSQENSTNSGKLNYSSDLTAIVAGRSPYSDAGGDFRKCDIETVDLQRWVNVTAVLTGRNLDIYMDGKLSRSCLMDGLFMVDGDVPTIKLGGPNGFGGLIGITRAANFAYSPDTVYSYYQQGPFTSEFGLDFSQYALNIKKNNSIIFTTEKLN